MILRRVLRFLTGAFAFIAVSSQAHAADVILYGNGQAANVVHDNTRTMALAAGMLVDDLRKVSALSPVRSVQLKDCAALCIVVGVRGSPLVEAIARDTGVDLAALDGQWERYARVSLTSRSQPSRRYLLIAGSDPRGAVWGVVDLTREMGVSAWEWWADVTPGRVKRLVVDGSFRLSASPSVQYRGIFLNDEDWGLQPWAAKTFEPETGDIGPRTYARIFELMWRLKANLIWPAMHDSTRPFYQIPGNADVAHDYAIVVGTSHAEPMMRNNVREWDEGVRGPFNIFTNRERMIAYWRERAEEVKAFDNMYSVGLRGKHDSQMEGASSPEAARDALAGAIGIQRDLLASAQGRPASTVPQALTLYKEVLDLYSLGLKVPDDVTLVWPEDNYGYIKQLPTQAEQARGGGAGVYYHISYWGRPHDYLWLATTHPALIREQLDRAWQQDARRIWVVNVGDIKPAEYLTQYFLDLAFDRTNSAQTSRDHLEKWMARQFGAGPASKIARVMTEYYDLAFERRPEFMGFNQVEPTRPVTIGDYMRSGGAEAWQRIDRYADLVARAESLAAAIPADRQDAYFQLVLYPVRGAASLNERNLKLDLAALYTRQGRPVANRLSRESAEAHNRIVADTAKYNAQNGGKWRGMMNMAPRGLPVFAKPAFPQAAFQPKPGCVVDASALQFVKGRKAAHSLAIYSLGIGADWRLSGHDGVLPDVAKGRLDDANGYEQRVTFRYDGGPNVNFGSIACAGRTIAVGGKFIRPFNATAAVEIDKTISLPATSPIAMNEDWERIEGLGSRQAALRSRLFLPSRAATTDIRPLRYSFHTGDVGDAELRVVALPVHPLTSANGLRIAVQLDDGPMQVLDFETHGRSEEWKQNVLGNTAQRRIAMPRLAAGDHNIRIYALDPGFVLDRLDVRLDGAADGYGAPPAS